MSDAENQCSGHALQLLQECQKITEQYLLDYFKQLLAKVDDALFAEAEQATSNNQQNLLFANMRLIRGKRDIIQQAFYSALAAKFSAFSQPQGASSHSDLSSLPSHSLSLVQHDDYEESLIITNLSAKIEGRCTEPLWSLEQRLTAMKQGQKVSGTNNPMAPGALIKSFIDSLRSLELDKSTLNILIRLFDRHILSEFEGLIEKINKHLIQKNILPNLKHGTQIGQKENCRSKSPTASTEPGSAATSSTPLMEEPPHKDKFNPPDHIAESSASLVGSPPRYQPAAEQSSQSSDSSANPIAKAAELEQQTMVLFRSIAQLLSQQPGSHNPQEPQPYIGINSYASMETDSKNYSRKELIHALNELQQPDSPEQQNIITEPQPTGKVKESLIQQLESTTVQPHRLEPADANIIDLVGMLFEFILDDDELPDHIKAILSHLHTPYLKLALTDRKLFEQHQHPARKLLNLMAQTATKWMEPEKDERGICSKIEYTVERILTEYQTSNDVLDELLADFERFVRLIQRQSQAMEKRVVDAAKGREKLLSARSYVQQALAELVSKYRIPTPVQHFLEQTWTEVLIFTYLRHQDNSEAWHDVIKLTEKLCWSVQPKHSQQERQQLRTEQPGLIKLLKENIRQLGGLQSNQLVEELKPIVACQRFALKPEDSTPHTDLEESKSSSARESLGSLIEEPKLPTDEQLVASLDPKMHRILADVEFGTWFSFHQNGTQQRLKLAWYSPTTLNYMFVDYAGNRAAVKGLVELATELSNGSTKIISRTDTPLVDRALNAIYSVLSKFSTTKPEPAEKALS